MNPKRNHMTIKRILIALLLPLMLACKKDRTAQHSEPDSNYPVNLSLQEVKTWLSDHSIRLSDTTSWESSGYQSTATGTSWQILLKQKPEMNGIKGYSK